MLRCFVFAHRRLAQDYIFFHKSGPGGGGGMLTPIDNDVCFKILTSNNRMFSTVCRNTHHKHHTHTHTHTHPHTHTHTTHTSTLTGNQIVTNLVQHQNDTHF